MANFVPKDQFGGLRVRCDQVREWDQGVKREQGAKMCACVLEKC